MASMTRSASASPIWMAALLVSLSANVPMPQEGSLSSHLHFRSGPGFGTLQHCVTSMISAEVNRPGRGHKRLRRSPRQSKPTFNGLRLEFG